MQPNARTPPKNKNYEQPPTAWRTFSSSTIRRETSNSRQEKYERTRLQSRSHSLDGPGPRIIQVNTPSYHPRKSNELSVQHHVTRDSMLDNILLSFNHMHDGEGPYPKQPPLYSSFKDGEFTLDTPRFVYDAITHMRSHSQSSSASSSPDLKQQSTFGPYEISDPTITDQPSTGTLQSTISGKTLSDHIQPYQDRLPHPQTQSASAPVSPRHATPKKHSRGTNSMDFRGRKSREASRSRKSAKAEASTEASPIPANATILQPTKSNTQKKSDAPSLANSPRERPGFLRRVFGSSRSQSQVRQPPPEQVVSVPVSPENTPVRKPSDSLPVLNKKASFFRRKKKESHENENFAYGPTRASLEATAGSPRLMPGLALTTDEQHLASSWAGPGFRGEERPFEVSYDQTYEPMLTKPTKRIWIQPDEYDRVIPAPIRVSNNELVVIEGPGARTMPSPIRSSALSQVLHSLYNSNGNIPPSQGTVANGHDDPFVEKPVGTDMSTRALHSDHGDRDLAKRMYDGDDADSSQWATLLGQQTEDGERLRLAYMDLFNFTDVNILSALRELCARLALRAESQQVDRILAAFSHRWWQCNPNSGFLTKDVVHTICYSLFLLNTDLHVADHDQKMTKNQFIRNALPTLRSVAEGASSVDSAAKENLLTVRPSSSSALEIREGRPSLDRGYSEGRLSVRPKLRPASGVSSFTNPMADTLDPLVSILPYGNVKVWENNLETVLREFYTSIRQQRLPLSGAPDVQTNDESSIASHSIRASTTQRTTSTASKELLDFGKPNPRWNRAKGKPSSTSTSGTGRPSSEDQHLFNPSASANWSRSYGKTLSSKSTMSIDSDTRPSTATRQEQSIGFANALGQTLGSTQDESSVDESLKLDDDVLQLAGAPWAKEGLVQHKHQLQTMDKKNRDRHWTECFAVVGKGRMQLFSFTSKASVRSQRQKSIRGGVVGGGNWTESAESLGSFTLIRTLADILPKGYGPGRPHAFKLTLSGGAVHIFQVGTPDIAREFVDTINYWSARCSPQPLSGGVSSIEYGWSDAVLNSMPEPGQPRSSFQSSIRSGIDSTAARSSSRARLPGDRLAVAEWTPPALSMQPSNLSEGQQLTALMTYHTEVEQEIQVHSTLRARMRSAYTPAQVNAMKALANWERKSAYLTGEATRVSRYIDSLNSARVEEEKVRLGKR